MNFCQNEEKHISTFFQIWSLHDQRNVQTGINVFKTFFFFISEAVDKWARVFTPHKFFQASQKGAGKARTLQIEGGSIEQCN